MVDSACVLWAHVLISTGCHVCTCHVYTIWYIIWYRYNLVKIGRRRKAPDNFLRIGGECCGIFFLELGLEFFFCYQIRIATGLRVVGLAAEEVSCMLR